MDVLQLVKHQHSLVRSLCEAATAADGVVAKRKACEKLSGIVGIQLGLEANYILPEVVAVDASAQKAADQTLARQKHILTDMKALSTKLKKRPAPAKSTLESATGNLCKDLMAHLSAFEDEILPRIRQRIPTQDREDLGESLRDVLADELEASGITVENYATEVQAV